MTGDEDIRARCLELLQELGGCPAVSFHEEPVAECIRRQVEAAGLSIEADRYGNLIVHRPGQLEDQPPIAFVAHMDHPGFEAVEASGYDVVARALGGVPELCLKEAVGVQVILPGGERLPGNTAGAHGPPEERMVSLRVRASRRLELPRPVILDMLDFYFDGDLIHMRALDDLAGCAAIVVALEALASEENAGDVYGVFTRAEEVGLVGARLLAEEGTLPQDTLVVSLEASKTLPGADIGAGPIIRVGDASFTFDAEAESPLLRAREKLTEASPGFKTQRQLMSGGTCEASAFRYHGYATTGIAFPLGNYHNATPDGGVGAEYIQLGDLVAGVELIMQATQSVADRHDSRPWHRMRDMPQEYRERLAEAT